MRKVLFMFTLLAFVLTSSAWAADISGTWAVKMKSPQNEDEAFDLVIKASGEKLTITCSNHPKLTNLAGTGTIKGDAVTMKVKATGSQPVEFAFTGKVAGNKMTGTREISMNESAGGQGGAASGAQGSTPAGGGQQGGQAAPGGAQGSAPAVGQGGAPGGAAGGAPGAATGEVSKAFTAEKK